eukprot:Opistho-1_new@75768
MSRLQESLSRYAWRRAEQGCGRFGVERSAEQVALALFATGADQRTFLVARVDALGGNRHAQALPQTDQSLDDPGTFALAGHRADEAAVDLDLVQPEAAQVIEARIAGPEIVEGDADPRCPQRAQDIAGVVEIGDERALGHVDFEPFGCDARFREDLLDALRELLVTELAGMDVDRQGHMRGPGPGRDAGAPQHALADHMDQSHLFGDRGEPFERDLAAFGIDPARGGVEPDHGMGAQVEGGAIDDVDAVMVQRVTQRILHHGALADLGVHSGFEKAQRAASLALRTVERDIGLAHRLLDRRGVGRDQRDADPGAHAVAGARCGDGELQRLDHAERDVGRGFRIGQVRGEDRELVAAESCDKIAVAHRGQQPLRHTNKYLVPCTMAMNIIDPLKPVEVEQEHGMRRIRSRWRVERSA